MKKIYTLIIFATLLCNFAKGQNVNIPDAIFKNYLVAHYDTSNDGEIQMGEALIPNYLDVSNLGISDLTGISAFTNLNTLYCQSNNLTSLDMYGNTALTNLACANNNLTSLNVSANTALTVLWCVDNNLVNLNVSSNTALSTLECQRNQLTSLTLNTGLGALICSENQLTSLNLSQCPTLSWLNCYSNFLQNLNVSANTALTNLYCGKNLLTTLNVSTNHALTSFDCSGNSLNALDVSGNPFLSSLGCDSNLISILDVNSNTVLEHLFCAGNQLSSLDVSQCPLLTLLSCSNNQLTNLNVQNGNNSNFASIGPNGLVPAFNASNNPNLICIAVDDTVYSKNNWLLKDPWASFSLGCNSISGTVKNPEANFTTGNLDMDNCLGCTVKLYQGGNLLNTQTTSFDGVFSFTGINGNNLKVVAEKTSGALTSTVTYDSLNIGDVLTIKVPATLISQVTDFIDSLDSKEFTSDMFYGLANVTISANGYNETSIQNLTSNYQNIQNNYDAVINSLSHLLIAQTALQEFSNDAAQMTSETIVSTYSFGEALYGLVTINKRLDNVLSNRLQLIKELKNSAFKTAIETVKNVFVQSCYSQNPTTFSSPLKSKFQGGMDFLCDVAESKSAGNFVENFAFSFCKDYLTTEFVPFVYSKIYVPQTQNNVTNANFLTTTLSTPSAFTASYNNVFQNSNNTAYVQVCHQKTITAQNIINTARTVSSVADAAHNIAQIAALATTFFDGGAMLEASTILKAVNVAAAGTALGTSVYRLNQIKNELPSATASSFKIHQSAINQYTSTRLAMIATNLSGAVVDYNNQLVSINTDIANNQRASAIFKMDSLIVLDSLLQAALLDALSPIYAAAPYAGNAITNFDSLFNYTIINDASASMFQRQAINYNFIAYLLDSTHMNIIDSLNQNAVSTINANNQAVTSIQNMNSSITGIAVPAHLFVTSISYQKPMVQNSSYPMVISYKNSGATIGDSIYAKISLKDGFTTTQDSIYIGTVGLGSSGTLTFNVNSPSFDTISIFSVLFYSPNTTSDGIGSSFVVRPFIGIKTINESPELDLTIYPNPFRSETTIEFNQEQKNITVKVFDVLGKQVVNRVFSGKNFILEKGNLLKGVYFLQISNESELDFVRRKIVIQ